MYSTSRTAMLLDISPITLKRWYKWYEDDSYKKPYDFKGLPPYTTDGRGTKFFTDEALDELVEFKDELENGHWRGCMAEFNANYQWGKRGKKILERKSKNE